MVRIKHRYLLLNILYPSTSPSQNSNPDLPSLTLRFNAPTLSHITPGTLASLLRAQLINLFGDYGLGLVSPSLKVVYFSPATSTAIVRAPRKGYRLLWVAATAVQELPGARGEKPRSCVVRCVRVSGTIRKAEEEVARRGRRLIVRMKALQEGRGVLQGLLGAGEDVEMEQGIEDRDDGQEMDEDSDGD